MLLTLLQATAQASSTASKINVEQLLNRLLNWGIEVGKDILAAIIIYIVGRFIIKQISRLVSKILEKRKLEISVQTFLKKSAQHTPEPDLSICHHQQIRSRNHQLRCNLSFCRCSNRYGIVRKPV